MDQDMRDPIAPATASASPDVLPRNRNLYINGSWREAAETGGLELTSPATGASLGFVAQAGSSDVDAAVRAAGAAYRGWRNVAPAERAKILRRIAQIVRDNARELALIDAIDGGNPVHEMLGDVANAASQLDFFAGLVTEMKGQSVRSAATRSISRCASRAASSAASSRSTTRSCSVPPSRLRRSRLATPSSSSRRTRRR